MIISLVQLSPHASLARWGDYYPEAASPKRNGTGGRCLLFCLAPHGVFRAPELARRAVGSYPAFSPLPPNPCGKEGGLFSVTLSVSGSFRRPLPAFITRHAALWCPDFPPGPAPKSKSRRPFRVPPPLLPPPRGPAQPQPAKTSRPLYPAPRFHPAGHGNFTRLLPGMEATIRYSPLSYSDKTKFT